MPPQLATPTIPRHYRTTNSSRRLVKTHLKEPHPECLCSVLEVETGNLHFQDSDGDAELGPHFENHSRLKLRAGTGLLLPAVYSE
jgi:hypothetical protein